MNSARDIVGYSYQAAHGNFFGPILTSMYHKKDFFM